MFKKHRILLTAIFIVVVGMFACCVYFENYYTSREASAQVNGYRIDFKYDFDMEFAETILKITRSDGKSAETMWKMQRYDCTQLAILQIDTKMYFACAGDIISAETQYLDTRAVSKLIYDLAWPSHSRVLLAGIQNPDQQRAPIVSLDARQKHSGMTVS